MLFRSTSEKEAMKSRVVHEKFEPIHDNNLMDINDNTETHKVDTKPVPVATMPYIAPTAITTTTTNTTTTGTTNSTTHTRARRPPQTFSDQQIVQEMDVTAVEKTRSYRSWLEVPEGGEFVVRTGSSAATRCYRIFVFLPSAYSHFINA